MADGSYLPLVYRKQGGDILVVASGGKITVESGGTIDNEATITSTGTNTIESGGTLNINSGATLYNKGTLDSTGAISLKGTMALTGVVTATSDGRIVKQHNAYVASSTAALGNIMPYGHALVGSSSAGAHAYKIRKPQTTGDRMTLICRGSSGALTIVPATGAYACKFLGTAAKGTITFGANAEGAALDLVAVTSTNWGLVGYSTSWTGGTISCS